MAISYMVDVDNEWLVLSDVHTIKHILELNDDSKTLTQLANSKMKKKNNKKTTTLMTDLKLELCWGDYDLHLN